MMIWKQVKDLTSEHAVVDEHGHLHNRSDFAEGYSPETWVPVLEESVDTNEWIRGDRYDVAQSFWETSPDEEN